MVGLLIDLYYFSSIQNAKFDPRYIFREDKMIGTRLAMTFPTLRTTHCKMPRLSTRLQIKINLFSKLFIFHYLLLLLINQCFRHLDLKHLNVWSRNVEVNDQILHSDGDNSENCSQLSALNLAHNAFSCIPVALPCLAVNLTRLNLSYNK